MADGGEVLPAELSAGPGAEDLFIGSALGLHGLVLLIEVDQEIRLHQDLIVQTLDICIGMVAADDPAYPVDDFPGKAEEGQESVRLGGPQLLLGLAGVGAIELQGLTDADVCLLYTSPSPRDA